MSEGKIIEKRKKEPSRWIYAVMISLFKKTVLPAPFFSKKPNNNGAVEDCLAIMTMAAVNHLVGIKEQTDKGNYEIAAILLRSLLEVTANITYIFNESKTRGLLADRFLRTAEVAPLNLFAINNNKKPVKIEWTRLPISKRIEALGQSEVLMYKFLSSYAHSDAGYMAAYYHNYRQSLGSIFIGFSALYLWSIMDNLAKLDLVKKENLGQLFYETIKKRLPELQG